MNLSLLKPLFFFLLQHLLSAERRCNTFVLRSFAYRSLIRPNNFNPLCPSIAYNCCTNNDIMRMHKIYVSFGKGFVESYHNRAMQSFLNSTNAIKMIATVNFTILSQAFQQLVNPPISYMNHLNLLIANITAKRPEVYINITNQLFADNGLGKYFAEIRAVRNSVFCTMCNWANHRFFRMGSQNIVYHQQFCGNMTQRFIDRIYNRISEVYRYILLADELLMLLNGEGTFTPEVRNQYRRYISSINKCRADTEKPENCQDFCREFNINRFSPLFDGEPDFVSNFTNAFERQLDSLKSMDGSVLIRFFRFRLEQWSEENIGLFRNETSVLSLNAPLANTLLVPQRSFPARMRTQGYKNFLEYKHVSNTIQLDTMDDELSSYPLYYQHDQPQDISLFVVLVNPLRGINFFRDGYQMNLEVSVDALLGSLTSGGSTENVDEMLENDVVTMIKDVDLSDIKDFMIDVKMRFSRRAKRKRFGGNFNSTKSSIRGWKKKQAKI